MNGYLHDLALCCRRDSDTTANAQVTFCGIPYNMPGVVSRSDGMDPPASSTAPIYTVPSERVVSIEHPCIVRNFDNGLKSLGGEPQLKHVSCIAKGRTL